MLTARGHVGDRIRGLDAGADDYLAKPFDFGELLARLRALMRRAPRERPAALEVGDLVVDPATHEVTRAGAPVALTAREFAVLEYLARHAGEVVTRAHLLDHVWDANFEGSTNIVDVYVGYLRRKLEQPFDRPLIRTIRGVGLRAGGRAVSAADPRAHDGVVRRAARRSSSSRSARSWSSGCAPTSTAARRPRRCARRPRRSRAATAPRACPSSATRRARVLTGERAAGAAARPAGRVVGVVRRPGRARADAGARRRRRACAARAARTAELGAAASASGSSRARRAARRGRWSSPPSRLAPVDRSVHRVLVLLLIARPGGAAGHRARGLVAGAPGAAPDRPHDRARRRRSAVAPDRGPPRRSRHAATRSRTSRRTLNAMLDRIERGVEEQHRLVADASHELRTPLAAMRSEIDVSLRADALPPAARRVLESAREEVDRMSAHGRRPARPGQPRRGPARRCWHEPVDLHDVVAAAAVALAGALARARGVSLQRRRAPRRWRSGTPTASRTRCATWSRTRSSSARRAARSSSRTWTHGRRGRRHRPRRGAGRRRRSARADLRPLLPRRSVADALDRGRRPGAGHLARDRAGPRRARLGRRRRRAGQRLLARARRALRTAAAAFAHRPSHGGGARFRLAG